MLRTGLKAADSGTSTQFPHSVQALEETRLHSHHLAAFTGLLAAIASGAVTTPAINIKPRNRICRLTCMLLAT